MDRNFYDPQVCICGKCTFNFKEDRCGKLELLKLPICPQCNDTKNVVLVEPDQARPLIMVIVYDVFKCNICNIEWSKGFRGFR